MGLTIKVYEINNIISLFMEISQNTACTIVCCTSTCITGFVVSSFEIKIKRHFEFSK